MKSEDESNKTHEFYTWLYKTYRPLMISQASRYSSDKAAIEDIIHDALEKLLVKYDTLYTMDCNRLASYIVLTIKSVAISKWRSDKARLRLMESLQIEDSPVSSAEDALMQNIFADSIRSAWSMLSEDDRTILSLKHMLGLSNKELSVTYHCTESTIRSKLFRAKHRLKQALDSVEEVKSNE